MLALSSRKLPRVLVPIPGIYFSYSLSGVYKLAVSEAKLGTWSRWTLDLASGYYQIQLEDCDCKKTAFITRYGLFEHTRMGIGLCNAPATF
jgi:hypothetical protein